MLQNGEGSLIQGVPESPWGGPGAPCSQQEGVQGRVIHKVPPMLDHGGN